MKIVTTLPDLCTYIDVASTAIRSTELSTFSDILRKKCLFNNFITLREPIWRINLIELSMSVKPSHPSNHGEKSGIRVSVVKAKIIGIPLPSLARNMAAKLVAMVLQEVLPKISIEFMSGPGSSMDNFIIVFHGIDFKDARIHKEELILDFEQT